MTATAPRDLAELLDTLAESPETQLLAGGTDFMVEVNFGRRDPRAVVALRRVDELRGWERDGDVVTLRAGLTFTEMEREPIRVVGSRARASRAARSDHRRSGMPERSAGTSVPRRRPATPCPCSRRSMR